MSILAIILLAEWNINSWSGIEMLKVDDEEFDDSYKDEDDDDLESEDDD